jgi:hypothetical protein
MDIPFYKTTLGMHFFNNQVPRAVAALERIASALEARGEPGPELERIAAALEAYSGPDPDEPIGFTLTEKGKATVAEITAAEPPSTLKGQWYCERCGGTDVEGTFWCKLNTREIAGDDTSDEYWCPACDEHVTVEFKEPT